MGHGILRTILLVAGKELRSSLRDRQTVLYTVVLPLVMYPALFWVMLQGFTYVQGRDAATVVHVAISGAPPEITVERLRAELEGEVAPVATETGGVRVTVLPTRVTAEEARRLVVDGEARAANDDPPDSILRFDGEEDAAAVVVFDSTRSRSILAANRLRARLDGLAAEVRAEAVRARGGDPAQLAPFVVREENLASERDVGGYILSFILPLTFVIMAVLGAFYPAVDSTAGEKERRTAETTMLLPVPRGATLLGKVLAVFVAALVATGLNLLGMALAAEHLLAGLAGDGGFAIEIPWSSFLTILPLCVAFLFLISAILVAVASLADTFKQGQALLGIVQQVFILPAIVAVLPGVRLTTELALVPVVQTVLAFKAVLQTGGTDGGASTLAFVLVGVSQVVYAGLALLVAVRLTSRESTLTGGASLRRLFSILRSRGAPR